jgi:glc operon protein GlcG
MRIIARLPSDVFYAQLAPAGGESSMSPQSIGELIYLENMDGAITGGVSIAHGKARSAALFKAPTKAFRDAVAAGGGGMIMLGVQGAVPLDGGLPIVMDGKIVGAIGVSGAIGNQDAQCAKAGADALK